MWYYQHFGRKIGPVSEETIRSLLLSQILNIYSLVWKEGMNDWIPIHQTNLANGLPLPPPPIPGPIVSNTSKERVAYVLLAVFLGHLGIHNFYAGYTSRAVFQLIACLAIIPFLALCSCGVGLILYFPLWIWVVIEACTVTKDANGVDFK